MGFQYFYLFIVFLFERSGFHSVCLAHRQSGCSSLLWWIGRYSILHALGWVWAEILQRNWMNLSETLTKINFMKMGVTAGLSYWFASDSTDPHGRLHGVFSESPEKMRCQLVEYWTSHSLACLSSVWAESIFNEVRPDIHGSAWLAYSSHVWNVYMMQLLMAKLTH